MGSRVLNGTEPVLWASPPAGTAFPSPELEQSDTQETGRGQPHLSCPLQAGVTGMNEVCLKNSILLLGEIHEV